MEPFQEAAKAYVERNGPTRFLLPTVPRQEARIRELAAAWPQEIRPEIGIDPAFKWNAFAAADAAIAASGTVILELALAGVPTISVYKTDWIFTMLSKRVKTWTGALPNLIADYVVVPEYFNEVVRAGSMLRWAERSHPTPPSVGRCWKVMPWYRNACAPMCPRAKPAPLSFSMF